MPTGPRYRLATDRGAVGCRSLVIATGGLSIPKIPAPATSATGSRSVRPAPGRAPPGLVPLTARRRRLGALRRSSPDWRWPVEIETRRRPAWASTRTCCSRRGLSGQPCCRSRATGSPARRSASTWRQFDLAQRLLETRAARAQAGRQRARHPAAVPAGRRLDAPEPGLAAPDRRSLGQVALHLLARRLSRWKSPPPAARATAGPRSRSAASTRVSCRRGPMVASSRPAFHRRGADITSWLGRLQLPWAWPAAACAHGAGGAGRGHGLKRAR